MRATRCLLTAALLTTAALAAPAVAGPCGPTYQTVESLRITVGEPVVRQGVTEIRLLVTRATDASQLGVSGADVALGRGAVGALGFGRGVTDERGVAVLRLTRKVPGKGWTSHATASRVSIESDGCRPGVIETGAQAV